MHPKVRQAIEEIDAAVFGGDTFEDRHARETLLERARDWVRELESIAEEQRLSRGETP